MALKIAGKLEELRKTEEKIGRLQEKKKLLERSIKRDEDEEIVKALRTLNLSHEELIETLGDIRAGKISADDLKRMSAGAEVEAMRNDGMSAASQTEGPGDDGMAKTTDAMEVDNAGK